MSVPLSAQQRPAGVQEEALVAGLTHEGEGVVHAGKTVFIAGALPGERIRFRRTRRHRQHDDGALLEVLEAAPERIAPRCPHFGVCGGCVLQHLAPAAQLAAKESELRGTLTRLARVAPERWLDPLTGPHWGYRRRARLGAKFVRRKETVVVGFRERAAPYVAQLRSCEVLAPQAAALIAPLATLLTGLSIRERVPQIEVAVGDDATALVLRVLAPPTAEDEVRLADFAHAQRVQLHLQPAGLGSVRALVAGAPLHYRIARFDIELQFGPTDFIQVNGAVNESLVQRVAELLEPGPASRVLDLYCGLGNFSLPLARLAAHVTGVEGDAALVERARSNARLNRSGNTEFHAADLGIEPDPAVPWMRGPYTDVLLDPPRTGARNVLSAIAHLAPQRLLYVSCHPGSLARDVGALVHEHGFTLAAAGVVDMFPHTAHVESIALLRRAARSGGVVSQR